MTDELNRLEAAGEMEYEHEDLSPKGIYLFLVGLALVGGVMALALWGLSLYMDSYEKGHQAPQSPLVAATASPEARRTLPVGETRDEIKKMFPEPRLEENERTELRGLRLGEEEELNSYGWVDQKAGIAHIPVERAMELVVQRGLPMKPSMESAAPSAAAKSKK